MRTVYDTDVVWDVANESVVLYNLGNGGAGSFRWSQLFCATYRNQYGQECPEFLPLDQRVDNKKCLDVIGLIGFHRASAPECVLAAMILNKDLAVHGLVMHRYDDGSERVYVDENKYVVNKMLAMAASSVNASQCVHSLLTRCRALMQPSRMPQPQ